MGSLHGHIPFYFVLILVLSSNHLLAKAHKNATAESKTAADFKVLAKTAGDFQAQAKTAGDFQAQAKTAADFQAIAKLAAKNPITNTDFKGLAKLALKNAIANGTSIYDRITLKLRKTSSPYIKRCLTGCSANYEDAIDLIKKSLAALDAKGYDDAKKWITGAKAFSSACEDRFQELVHQNSPIADMRTKFDRLCLSGIKLINSLVEKERLITEGCNQTTDKELCKSAVEFFLENKGLGLQVVAKLAVKKALKVGTKIHNHISVLLKTTSDKHIQKKLKSCSEFYQTAIDNIKDSLPALDSKRYSDASTWVGAATDWANTCEDMFTGKANKNYPLTATKPEFEKLVTIALSLIKKLAGN